MINFKELSDKLELLQASHSRNSASIRTRATALYAHDRCLVKCPYVLMSKLIVNTAA